MQTKCPTCGLERTVDAASHESGEEQMCDPCASSYKALLSEIELRAADRRADAAPDASGVTSAPLALTSPHGGAEEARTPGGVQAPSRDGQAAADADDYALGVSLYRVPAAGLIVVGTCLFSMLFLFGWLRPAGGATPEAAAKFVEIKDAVDGRAGAAVPAVADVSLSPAASHAPPATIAEPEAEEKAEEKADELEEVDEAELTQEESEAEEREERAAVAAPPAAASAAGGGRFTVQVGSYNKADEAEGRASGLRAAGFDAHVAAVEIPNKGTWFRVQSGRFQTREQAALYEKSLRASGGSDATFVAEVVN